MSACTRPCRREKIATLMKGSGVQILAEETVGEEETKWYKIAFDNVEGHTEGWIAAEFTVSDRTELLSEDLRIWIFLPRKKLLNTLVIPG